jgi:alpha-mannosidase
LGYVHRTTSNFVYKLIFLRPGVYLQLASADLVVPKQEAWRLMWDFNTLRQIIDNLPGNNALQNKAIVVANEIMDVFKYDDPSTVSKARKIAEKVLGKDWDKKGEKVYDEGTRGVRVWGIGHCE